MRGMNVDLPEADFWPETDWSARHSDLKVKSPFLKKSNGSPMSRD